MRKPRKEKTFIDDMPDDVRKGLIKKIHVAKRQLNLDEDQYRDLLERASGKCSCSEMDGAELNRALMLFRDFGFNEQPSQGKTLSPMSRNKSSKTPKDKAVALWITLANQGKIRDRSHQALGAFVKRFLGPKLTLMPGVDPLEAATPKQLHGVIEALKDWLDRDVNPDEEGK